MTSRGFFAFLAFLRAAVGVSLITTGLTKLAWFGSADPLAQKLADWSAHPANAAVAHYLAFASAHTGLLARVVVLGELGLGTLLVLGFLTPLAALLGFVMVLQFQFASSQLFSLAYLRGSSGLAYLLVFPVLMLGRAGTVLGIDGALMRVGRKPASS
jgi:uncharacterized membrane protein YphA (DoxX/SURF4 family)